MKNNLFIKKKCICTYLNIFMCILFLFNVNISMAAVTSNITSANSNSLKKQVQQQPYCGLYCLYAVITKSLDKNYDFSKLLEPDYISSKKGSSLIELKRAAEDNGLYANPVSQLTSMDLRKCHYPVILYVKPNREGKKYSHYVLFLGTENGKAKIFNPPNPVELISFAELALLWNGKGLIVSAEPIDLASVFAPASKRFILYASIVIAIIFFVHFAKRFLPKTLFNSRIKLMGISVSQAVGFTFAAVLLGMIYHYTNETGFLSRANATASIQEAHQGNFIPKISEKKVKELLDTDTIFIDARKSRDYEDGHLEGALSIPVDSNDIYRNNVTNNIAKDSQIVLYCQSYSCKYAEIVAIKLQEDGFTNISIYKGGWMDWKEKNSEKEETSS